MKKVLIISYYWPPGAGAGVFRWLKFCKYLPEHGWQPIVYTPSNPETPETDASLMDEIPETVSVIRRPIWEPYGLYKRLSGRKKTETIQPGFLQEAGKPSPTDHLATWIRGNLFIPDARRFWIGPSIRFLTRWLRENPVDAIVSTGPPHSMHLIALGIKKRLNLPWLADFRDPWTQIDFYHHLKLLPWADKKHHRLEKKVMEKADRIVTVSQGCARGLSSIAQRVVEVIPNGYDPPDFNFTKPESSAGFVITHMGAMNADRNPQVLWKVLAKMVHNNPTFGKALQIHLIGKSDYSVKESLQKFGLERNTQFTPYLPHQKALRQASRAHVLLLPLNNTPNAEGITPGKLYEYLGLGAPILCIGPPKGDASNILNETGSGYTIDFNDEEGCIRLLENWLRLHKQGIPLTKPHNVASYTRHALTTGMAGLLHQMVSG